MHLCAELIAEYLMLGPLEEVGANFSLQLSLRTQLLKSIIKKLPPKINVKNIKNRVYYNPNTGPQTPPTAFDGAI